MNRRFLILFFTAYLSFFASLYAVADPPSSSGPPAGNPGPQTNDIRRASVYRDPATGQVRVVPSPAIPANALSLREQNMLNRSDEGLQSKVLANGAVAVNLQGRFQSMVTVNTFSGSSQATISCLVGDQSDASDATQHEAQ
jgi:hypothetical protein